MSALSNLFAPYATSSETVATSSQSSLSSLGSLRNVYEGAAEYSAGRYQSALRMLNQIVESESALRADIIDALALRGEVKCALYGNLGGDTDFRAVLAIDPQNLRVPRFQSGGCATKHPSRARSSQIDSRRKNVNSSAHIPNETHSDPMIIRPNYCPGPKHPKIGQAHLKAGLNSSPYRPPILLPYEVWRSIAGYLSPKRLRSWFTVSCLHRAVAHEVLFSFVRIRFSKHAKGVSETRTARRLGYDIVKRIAEDGDFAKNIRSLELDGYGQAIDGKIEGSLIRAMSRLSSLRSIRLSQSELPATVVDAIVAVLPNIQELHINQAATIHPSFTALSSLHSFSLSDVPNTPKNRATAYAIIKSNVDMLRQLEIDARDGGEAWLESSTLSKLQTLRYVDSNFSHIALKRILTEATDLQELVLHVRPAPSFAPASLFKANAKALPNLRALSLRINDRFALDLGLFSALFEFIRDRPSLEMLAIEDFAGADRMIALGLGDCLATLPNLKALRIAARYLRIDILEDVLVRAPKTIEALGLGITPGGSGEYQSLIVPRPYKYVSSLSALRGLVLYNVHKKPISYLFSEEFASTLRGEHPQLEFVGIEKDHIWIELKTSGGAVDLNTDGPDVDAIIGWTREWRSNCLDDMIL